MIYLLELIAYNTSGRLLEFREYVDMMAGKGGFPDIHDQGESDEA